MGSKALLVTKHREHRMSLSLSANRGHDRKEVSDQLCCPGIRFAKTMLRGNKPVIITLNKLSHVVNSHILEKIFRYRNRSVIANNGTLTLFKHCSNSSLFP